MAEQWVEDAVTMRKAPSLELLARGIRRKPRYMTCLALSQGQKQTHWRSLRDEVFPLRLGLDRLFVPEF